MQTFQQALRESDFTLCAELPLSPASTRRDIVRDIATLGPAVKALQITDNPTGIPHLSPLVAAGICLDEGCDAVLHLSGRDRNRIALQSDLLGAAAAGVTSLLLLRGEKLPASFTPRAHKVFELGAKRLLRAAQLIGGETGLVAPPGFLLGSMIRVLEPRDGWHPQGIEAKADVGCKFVQTQPLLDIAALRAYMQRLVESRVLQRVSVIVSVPVPTSADQLEKLLQSGRPALVPGEMLATLGNGSAARRNGIAMTAAALRDLRGIPGIAGANLVAIEDVDAAVEAISLSEIPG